MAKGFYNMPKASFVDVATVIVAKIMLYTAG